MVSDLAEERVLVQEMTTIATECATILRTLGDSIKNMKKFASEDIMKRAEEAAVALQFKIYLNTNVLLGNTNPELPSSPMFPSSSPFANKEHGFGNWPESSYIPEDYFGNPNTEEGKSPTGPPRASSQPINILSSQDRSQASSAASSPGLFPGSGSPQGSILRGKSVPVKKSTLETLTEGVPAIHVSVPKSSVEQVAPEQGDKTPTKAKRSLAWQQTFSFRKDSLGLHWDGTLERISALSLVKFASLLIEVVTKMRYVVDAVEDLGEQAMFEECDSS